MGNSEQMSKVKDIATHKASVWTYISGALITALYSGYQTVGAPITDKLLIEVNLIKAEQEKYIKLSEEIILNQRIDLGLRFPESLIDSMKKEIVFEMFFDNR